VLHGVRCVFDDHEHHEAVIVPMVPGWRDSLPIQRGIFRARNLVKLRRKVLFLDMSTRHLRPPPDGL
jgi:hypothetical protein